MLPGGVTHGMAIWFLIGSLLGGILFINASLLETPWLQIPQATGLDWV